VRFAETTGEELDKALEALDENSLKGLILDLRDNPGGALTQALAVSDRFLDSGQMIVSTRTRNGKDESYRARKNTDHDYPMVVLINQNSASASEIVSGALQDHDRALILGETSFGKALVQTIYPIEGKRGLALTTGKYYTPSDRLIQRDYSESFWDYYNNRNNTSNDSRTEYFTDSGRVVFGGGGITPDEKVELERPNRIVRRIRGSLFREFASKLYSGQVQTDIQTSFPTGEVGSFTDQEVDKVIKKIQVSDQTFAAFKEFIIENKADVTTEELVENRDVISNLLKQELLLLLVGDEASYKVALDLDKQVQTAIERMPAALTLLDKHPAQISKEASGTL
jgi:carboxyl-terminal processing protease